ncbi:Alpha/Beta hydrolase protein [Scheffersomyces xylosifermentans]|uniref:Alpha/Beta hydrolase protein n=1 Tax=Scheffersomyces xylosifermentans TaxID=1304137 RepID=UPI00315CA821
MPLSPDTSPFYTYSTKIVEASHPRYPGSVVLDKPTPNAEDYRLVVTYRKYVTTDKDVQGRTPLNLVFCHGNGMNKGLWHYHINKLFIKYRQSKYYVNEVLALDHVNHNDAAIINRGKLGSVYNWSDMAKDIIQIVKHNEWRTFQKPGSLNFLIAHSMSGFASLVVALEEPNLFTAIMPVNPVAHQTEEYRGLIREAYTKWYETNKLIDTFKIPDGVHWKTYIKNWYLKDSFFKRFHPAVLDNMIEDEIPSWYDENTHYNEVQLKHEVSQEYITYFSAFDSVTNKMPVYQGICTPIYHVWAEFDGILPEGVKFIRDNLKDVVIPIDLPGTYHSVNGDNPDLIIEQIDRMINDRIAIADSTFSKNDFGYKKQYGDGYKDSLIKATFKENLPLALEGSFKHKL